YKQKRTPLTEGFSIRLKRNPKLRLRASRPCPYPARPSVPVAGVVLADRSVPVDADLAGHSAQTDAALAGRFDFDRAAAALAGHLGRTGVALADGFGRAD